MKWDFVYRDPTQPGLGMDLSGEGFELFCLGTACYQLETTFKNCFESEGDGKHL